MQSSCPEAKNEEKSLKQAIKDVSSAEKEEAKAAKAESHSHASFEKAHKVEAKLANKLNQATASESFVEHSVFRWLDPLGLRLIPEHDQAVSKEVAAQNEAKAKEDAHQRAAAALQEKKAKLDQLQHAVSTEGRWNVKLRADNSTTKTTPFGLRSSTSCTARPLRPRPVPLRAPRPAPVLELELVREARRWTNTTPRRKARASPARADRATTTPTSPRVRPVRTSRVLDRARRSLASRVSATKVSATNNRLELDTLRSRPRDSTSLMPFDGCKHLGLADEGK